MYDEEVTISKRKPVLGHFEATEACKRPYGLFLSELWDVHMLIFGRFDGSVLQSTTDDDCMFLFNWLLSVPV